MYYQFLPAENFHLGSKIQESALHSDLKEYLINNSYRNLYSFQEEAFQSIMGGKHTAIIAPTASGKTEAFILPIFQKILTSQTEWGGFRSIEREVQAVLMYPTKSLARDQYQKLSQIGKNVGITLAVFDGDTPKSKRLKIRKNPPDILLTNPDILNWHLRNPNSDMRALISKAKYFVLDELHTYIGAFGSNVYFLIKRLKRLLPDAQFIGASATISNPESFTEQIFGPQATIIKCQEGRNSPLHFAILLPEDKATSTTIVQAIQTLIGDKRKLLVFANTHRLAELINLLAQERGIYSAVHRAGLPVRYRNLVEQSFKSNELDVLVATPTLELGIDIGTVDGVISALVSYTRLTQRIGRAGRKGQESVALLVLNQDDPISEFYAAHPQVYLSDYDPAYIEPQNERIAYHQILGACCDQPIKQKEFPDFKTTIQKLNDDKLIYLTPEGDYAPHWREATRALKSHSMRGVGDTIHIRHGSRTIGERAMPIALEELHPGAIYFNAGRKYKSKSFSFIGYSGFAQVESLPVTSQYRTTALSTALPKYLKTFTERDVFGVRVLFGLLQITKKVTGFVTKNLYSGALIKEDTLDKPIEYTYLTHGFIFKAPAIPKRIFDPHLKKTGPLKKNLGMKPDFYSAPTEEILTTGAYHALEHVLIEGSNMLTGGGSRELGGISIGKTGTIIVHDALPGGSGLSKLLYTRLEEALSRSYAILKHCSCKTIDGCPRCTYSYQCGNNNRPLFKDGALQGIKVILDNTPTQVEIKDYSIFDTFV
ncbi:MAG: DEAD/DEAH box helicase [Candidatus Ranarchaeia archaeon]